MKPASNEPPVETMLENLPPDIGPRLEKRLSSAPWTPRGVKRQRVLAMVYLAILFSAAFIGLTPQGRAFAQTIFKFFTTTDQSSFPLSQEEIDAVYEPIPTFALSLVEVTSIPPLPKHCSEPEDIGTYACEVQRVEEELNFDIKEFSMEPSGYSFAEIQFYPGISSANTSNLVMISYEISGAGIFLNQGIGDFPPDSDWEKVPESAVQPVKIGEYDGAYVNGSFGMRNGDTELTWNVNGADQRLRWREGERWFEILAFVGPGTSGYLDKKALISLASDMVYQLENPEQANNVDFDFIPNIALAEKICGCAILQPGKLPKDGKHLDHVKYDPERKSVILSYGYRALRIVQTPFDSAIIRDLDSYKNVETVTVGNAVGQYGVSPEQKTIWESASPPVLTTDSTYSVLLWEKDGMIYQIYFDQTFSGGGQLTKEQMIEIAESLH